MPTTRSECSFFQHAVAAALVATYLVVPASYATQKWIGASEADQAKALAFVEDIARTRDAGIEVVAQQLGADRHSKTLNSDGRVPAKETHFGSVRAVPSFDSRDDSNGVVVVRFSNGCVHRDFAKVRLGLKDVVWAPNAEEPNPAFGYGYITGNSAVTVFFDATGSKCMTAARVEPASALKPKLDRLHSKKP